MVKNKSGVLKQLFVNLKALESEFIDSTKRFIQVGNGKLYTMDLFASTINNRAIALLNGFITLGEANNFISAVPLIRMQVDNSLRFFATTLVSDYNDFFSKYLGGTKIGKIKDAKGNLLTDSYLARQLDIYFPGIHKLYQNTSGYIHLSNEHSFINTKLVPEKDRTIGISVGNYDFFDLDRKIDFTFNMQESTKILLVVIEQWRHRKEQLNAT